MTERLSLPDEQWPAQAFFNALSDGMFVETIERMADGIGTGYDDAGCNFPTDLDPGETPFDGVQFYIGKAPDVVLDHASVAAIARRASQVYLAAHPKDRPRLEAALSRLEARGKRK